MRDPYPAIGEKAVGRWGRIMSIVSITLTVRTELLLLYKMLTVFRFYQKKLPSVKKYFASDPKIFQLYGGGCVFIVLISQLLSSLMAGVGVQLTLCQWMVLVAAGLTPLTWMGTPKVSKHIYLSMYLSILCQDI